MASHSETTAASAANPDPRRSASTAPDPRHDVEHRGFSSDNASGAHPEVLAAITAANGGHVTAYGADPYTGALRDWARREFGERALILPVFNGTGANVVALQAMSPRWGAVICTADAHVATDENAAAERVAGLKLLTRPTPDGKLRPDDVRALLAGRRDVHTALPTVLSLTQSTEIGTAYSVDELRELSALAHASGLRVHVDGARIANAAVALGRGIGELALETGIDVLSLGATKTGALGAEAIVVLDPDAVDGVEFLRKIDLQLASKQRFLSAQLLAMFDGDLWRRTAGHANAMAQRLARGLQGLPGVSLPLPVEANGVFPVLPSHVAAALHEHAYFYDWVEPGMVRLLCSWDTTDAEVDAFLEVARAATNSGAA
ncbi:threonine aldolase family protein [Pseudoclavibacter endophyticus]|uniref:Threonine aldolase n=1 Tax=Pseudoclavibacter endophyticus TaxID=1778590 RepID=A0A6H9WMP1_9MICO|nr:beta-eliminating lyase-related protein [Pseudoclavibacter endophyticus]KAB1647816.1 threonine aldolase [Pseudoclavibacter endophyticus]